MSLEGIPKILYKYRSFQEDVKENMRYQRKALVNGELYFASHKQLNDPFDLKIRKRLELMPEKDIILHGVYYLAQNNREASFSSLWNVSEQKYKENIGINPDCFRDMSISGIESMNNSIDRGIACLSERNDDILMWAHYGNSNQGFCIGYNSDKLDTLIENNFISGIFKVHYFEEFPEIKPFIGNSNDFILKRFASKSNKWSYEKEWRIIIHDHTRYVLQIPNEIVEEIILGSNVLPESEKQILSIQKQKYPHAKVFKVEPDDSEFKLNVKAYKYQ